MTEPTVSLPTVRILLVGLTGVLGDVIRAVLEEQHDMTIVDEVPDCAVLDATLATTKADLALWCLDDDVPRRCPGLFQHHPSIKVLTVTDDGRRGYLWQLKPQASALGELSPGLLIHAVRKAVQA
jgi:hypothetical protein